MGVVANRPVLGALMLRLTNYLMDILWDGSSMVVADDDVT